MPRAFMLVMSVIMIRASVPLFARKPSKPPSLSSMLIPADTVYLNRKGIEINRGGISTLEKTFIVRTTRTTDHIYGARFDNTGKKLILGQSHSIHKKDARKTEALIRKGRFNEALATGNLVELWPLAVRRADWSFLKQDDGKGDTVENNNKEYSVTTDTNGRRVASTGPRQDPDSNGAFVDVRIPPNTLTNVHSHPSGTHNNSYFDPQAPSIDDIKLVPAGSAYWTVFGMNSMSREVYLYDSTGIIAILSIERYIR